MMTTMDLHPNYQEVCHHQHLLPNQDILATKETTIYTDWNWNTPLRVIKRLWILWI